MIEVLFQKISQGGRGAGNCCCNPERQVQGLQKILLLAESKDKKIFISNININELQQECILAQYLLSSQIFSPLPIELKILLQGVQKKMCFFQGFSVFCDLYLASSGLLLVVQNNDQPIGVTVHSYYFDYF